MKITACEARFYGGVKCLLRVRFENFSARRLLWTASMLSSGLAEDRKSDGTAGTAYETEYSAAAVDKTMSSEIVVRFSRRPPLIMLQHSTKPFLTNNFTRIHDCRLFLRNCSRKRNIFNIPDVVSACCNIQRMTTRCDSNSLRQRQ